MRNLYVTYKRGEVGKVIPFFLEDTNGAIDLSAWTVTLYLKKGKSSSLVIDGAEVVKRTQTGSDVGYCDWTLDGTTANIEAGVYKFGELKLVSGSNVLRFPTHQKDERSYFTVEVQSPVG